MLLPNFKKTFPKWKPRSISDLCSGLDAFALDLIEHLSALDPRDRLSARSALKHPYFDGLF